MDLEEIDGPNAETSPAIQLSMVNFVLVLFGLTLTAFSASFDETATPLSLAAISTEFNKLDEIAWVVVSYYLTATAFVPIYGQVADILGRKLTYAMSVIIFTTGLLICSIANGLEVVVFNFLIMVLGRAVTGLGAGGVYNLVAIIISDIVPVRKRGKFLGIIAACFGVSAIAGPILGGYFIDFVSYKWLFYLNIPISVLGLSIVSIALSENRQVNVWGLLGKIDFIGTICLVCGVIFILVPTQSGGTKFAWNSLPLISFFVAGTFLILLFLYFQNKHENPVIPLHLFKNISVVATFASAFFLGCSFLVTVVYTPLWFQVALGGIISLYIETATEAGFHSIPLILSNALCAIISGVVISHTGVFFPFLPLGAILISSGSVCMSQLSQFSPEAQIFVLISVGAGVGFVIQTTLISAQVSVSSEFLSVVTTTTNFFQSIGSVIGISISSAIFNKYVHSYIEDNLVRFNVSLDFPEGVDVEEVYTNPMTIWNETLLPRGSPQQIAVVEGYRSALGIVFGIVVGFGFCLLLATVFIKRNKLA